MGSSHYARCKKCGKPRTDRRPISWRGLCRACRKAHMDENAEQLHHKSGPRFQHWRERVAASVGATLPSSKPGS